MYKIIYADPPWNWRAWSAKGEGRSAKNHYDVMTLDKIKALDVESIADENSILFLWAIDPMLERSFEVINAWGFTYKTVGFYWIKTNMKSEGFFTGLGYYTRANPEQCLLATKGKPLQRLDKGIKKLVIAPRGRHSEKPAEVRHRITKLYGDIPRVELFARDTEEGWDVWGNEVENKICIPYKT